MGSHEMLRSSQALQSQRRVREKVPTSLAERIIARSPPQPPSPKPWLYLTDDAVVDEAPTDAVVFEDILADDIVVDRDPPADSPITTPSFVVHKTLGSIARKPSPEHHLGTASTPPIKAPSPISDSIPTRTSSLRQLSKSPASGKRKSKKSKRHTATPGKSETMSYKRSKSIPDASWADLDEDDETVKRIKQLRQQRKSRMQEVTTFPSPIESPHEESEAHHTLVHELAIPRRHESKQATRHLQAANGAAIDRLEQPKMRSSKREGKQPRAYHESPTNGAKAVSDLAESSSRVQYALEVKRPLSLQHRPTTSRSETSVQPPSLDYFYSQAVDTLNGIEQHPSLSRGTPSRTSSEHHAHDLAVKAPDQQGLGPSPQSKSSKRSKRTPEHRWTVHPDLPSDFERRKSRRKSMSDARHGRGAQEEGQLERRDSIEDAVVDYLDSPRLSRTVKRATSGRTIAFSEVGDPEGAAVFVCVGMGLTRYVTAFFDELAVTLRLRLITLDRPGVGGSEPFPSSDKSGPLSWPEDVLAVCQHLGIVKFSILAHSAGAIYALATALILPHLVKGKVHLLAPWVPPSQLEAISHPTASAPPAHPLPRSQRFLRVLPTPFLKAANSSFMTATSASLKPASKRSTAKAQVKSPPPRRAPEPATSPQRPMSHDRPEYNRRESMMMMMDQFMPEINPLENFPIPVKEEQEHDDSLKRGSLFLSATASPMDPGLAYANIGLSAAEHADRERQVEYTSRLTRRTWELATRDSNPATDLVVCLERSRDVGFRYTDVGREVVIHHGSEDKRVPLANVKWLAEQMNRRALGLNLGMDARESKESWADAAGKGGCEVRVLQGEGHGLMASPLIMGDVLEEIAGYWLGADKGRL